MTWDMKIYGLHFTELIGFHPYNFRFKVRLFSTSFTEYVFFALTAQDFCSDSSFECHLLIT